MYSRLFLLHAVNICVRTDVEMINSYLDVVEEISQKEDLFEGLRTVLGRFLDVNHLLSMCVQVPKEETVKTMDNCITTIICLKNTLEEVDALRMVLCGTDTDNALLILYQTVILLPGSVSDEAVVCNFLKPLFTMQCSNKLSTVLLPCQYCLNQLWSPENVRHSFDYYALLSFHYPVA